MMKVSHFLRQPYPVMERKWPLIAGVSLFVSLFMVIFQPFGLRELDLPYKLFVLAGYGMVTLVVLTFDLVLIPALFPDLMKESKWTVGKEMVWVFWIVLTIGIGNYLYSRLFFTFHLPGFRNLLGFLYFTAAVSVFPVGASVFLSYHLLLRRYLTSSGELNTIVGRQPSQHDGRKESVTLTDYKGKKVLEAGVEEICCMVSEGNYVEICLDRKQRSKVLVRNTMKEMTHQVSHVPFLFRCHRAFLVNLHKIEKVTGNSQGYKLKVTGYDEMIPVARNLSRAFRQRFGLH